MYANITAMKNIDPIFDLFVDTGYAWGTGI